MSFTHHHQINKWSNVIKVRNFRARGTRKSTAHVELEFLTYLTELLTEQIDLLSRKFSTVLSLHEPHKSKIRPFTVAVVIIKNNKLFRLMTKSCRNKQRERKKWRDSSERNNR